VLTTRLAQVICPSGGLLTGVSSLFFSDFQKIFVPIRPKSSLEPFASHPTRGAYHDRHGRGEGCGGRGSVLRAMDCRAVGERPVSDLQSERTRDVAAYGEACGPDAPTLASSSRSLSRPNRLRQKHIRGRRWAKSSVTGESSKETVKTIACGTPGDSGVLVYSCAFYQYKVHARLRVQRASGVPHASLAEDLSTARAHRAARA